MAESYGKKWQYIQKNPLRAGLSETRQNCPYRGKVNFREIFAGLEHFLIYSFENKV